MLRIKTSTRGKLSNQGQNECSYSPELQCQDALLSSNYKISLLLSDLLAKRFRKKDTNFNNQDSTSLLKTNLQLRMVGDEENSEISFEKLKIKENLKNEIKKEILDVKKIISEEINKKESDEEGEELEIEWDDNF